MRSMQRNGASKNRGCFWSSLSCDVTLMFNVVDVICVVPVVNIQSLHDVPSVDIPLGSFGYKRCNNNNSSVAFCSTPNSPEVVNNNKL